MSLKVRAYSLMPAFLKRVITRVYIWRRNRREVAVSESIDPPVGDGIQVIYVSGFPRSGTTMLKYYFADYPGLCQTAFTPVGFFDAWKRARRSDEILVDKSNHYVYSLGSIFAACGRGARMLIVIRDPRDCLVSFAKYRENREVPRDKSYWDYWRKQHADLLDFARTSGFGDLIYLVRYEDLVRFPEEAKASFLNWLGIDAEPGELDRSYRNEHPGEGWRDSVHEHREIGDHALQKWKKVDVAELPGWCRETLDGMSQDERTVEIMGRFGYTEDGFADIKFRLNGVRIFQPREAEVPVPA